MERWPQTNTFGGYVMHVRLVRRSRQAAREQRYGLAARAWAVIDTMTAKALRRRYLATSTVPTERGAATALRADRPSIVSPGAAMALDLAAHERLLDSKGEELDSAGDTFGGTS